MLQKIFDKVERIDRKKQNLVFLGILILISIVLFRKFIFGDYLFLYSDANDDTYQSFLPIYQMVVNAIINGHDSFMNFSSGFGENVISMQVAIFDPFAIVPYSVGLIFGVDKIAYSLVYTQIIRIIVASFACKFFLSNFQIDYRIQYIVSILYGFSAYSIGDIGQHYFFCTALVFVALINALICKCRNNKKYFLIYIPVVGVMCIWSVYFSYMILLQSLFLAIFIFWLEKDKKKYLSTFILPFFLSSLLGIILSAVIFIPSAILILTSTDRVSGGNPLAWRTMFMPFCSAEYKNIFLRFFSNQLAGSINEWNGFRSAFDTEHMFITPILFFCLVEYVICIIRIKDNVLKRMCIVLFCLIGSLIPLFGTIMNAFSNYSSRYLYVFYPLCAFVIAFVINYYFESDITNADRIRWCINISISLFLILKYSNWNNENSKNSSIAVCIFLVIFLFCFCLSVNKGKKMIMLAVILVSINIYDGSVSLIGGRVPISKLWYKENGFNNSFELAQDNICFDEDNFVRVERSYLDYGIQPATMYSNQSHYRGISFYNSLMTPRIKDFRSNLLGFDLNSQTRATYSFGDLGLPMNSVLADFYGIKYIMSDYVSNDSSWKLVGEYSGRYLYENNLSSAGLLYDAYIGEKDVENMSAMERQFVISHSIVLPDNYSGINNKLDDPTITYSENSLINEMVTLGNMQETEVFLEDSFSENEQIWVILSISANSDGIIRIMCETGFGYYECFWSNASRMYYLGDNEIIVNIPVDTKSIKIQNRGNDVLVINDLSIVSSKEHQYSSSGVSLENEHLSGKVHGIVNVEEDKYLFLPILYDKNWRAFLDGNEIEILCADYAFVGCYIPKGKHEFVLQYKTPGIQMGIILSLMGTVIYFGVVLCVLLHHNRGDFKHERK